jgi:hypothetical protein
MSAIIDLPVLFALVTLILLGMAAVTLGADSRTDFGEDFRS